MGSSPAEFRAKIIKTVTLPSGLSVEIKKLRQKDFIRFGELPLPALSAVEGPALSEEGDQPVAPTPPSDGGENTKSLDLIDLYGRPSIVKAAVNPRFSDKPEDFDNPDVVHLSLLSDEDLYFLIQEVLTWAGLNKEAGRTAESFRADKFGDNGGRPGAAIRETAD
jgi:hypothetical protein